MSPTSLSVVKRLDNMSTCANVTIKHRRKAAVAYFLLEEEEGKHARNDVVTELQEDDAGVNVNDVYSVGRRALDCELLLVEREYDAEAAGGRQRHLVDEVADEALEGQGGGREGGLVYELKELFEHIKERPVADDGQALRYVNHLVAGGKRVRGRHQRGARHAVVKHEDRGVPGGRVTRSKRQSGWQTVHSHARSLDISEYNSEVGGQSA